MQQLFSYAAWWKLDVFYLLNRRSLLVSTGRVRQLSQGNCSSCVTSTCQSAMPLGLACVSPRCDTFQCITAQSLTARLSSLPNTLALASSRLSAPAW